MNFFLSFVMSLALFSVNSTLSTLIPLDKDGLFSKKLDIEQSEDGAIALNWNKLEEHKNRLKIEKEKKLLLAKKLELKKLQKRRQQETLALSKKVLAKKLIAEDIKKFNEIKNNSRLGKKKTSPVIKGNKQGLISKSLSMAIQREKNKIDKRVGRRNVSANRDVIRFKSSGLKKSQSLSAQGMLAGFTRDEVTDPFPFNSTTEIQFVDLELGKNVSGKVSDFTIKESHYGQSFKTDSYNGKAVLEKNLKRNSSILNAEVLAQDFVPTKFDLPIEQGFVSWQLPLISEESLQNFLKSEKLELTGGILLSELHQDTNEIFLGSEAGEEYKRYLFSDDMKKVKDIESARYALFVNINPGNTVVFYQRSNKPDAHKLIHVSYDYLYLDINYYSNNGLDKFALYQSSLSSSLPAPLIFEKNNLVGEFISEKLGERQGLNKWVFNLDNQILGSRNYYEFTHHGESIFMGKSSDIKKVYLPDEDLKNYIIANKLNISNKMNKCVIQVNYNGSIEEISLKGEYAKGLLDFDVVHENQFGKTSFEITDDIKRSYFISDTQSILNLKVLYLDGKEDYLTSFCDPGSYFVEQL